ncbi:MAG TPA: hypothetical protein VFG04_13705 [Planctomycetaceae bacterium]|jgi:hypothetical protein|nr:hypothetical protein [Planctomycetaceae bacterium]
MRRIFLSLTIFSTLLLIGAFALGLAIGDPRSVSAAARKLMSYHLLTSVAALIFATFVHAVLLTYFMGTSRWMEEARLAYKLDTRWNVENRRLKYRTIPLMAACLLLLILNIPIGAIAVDRGNWILPGGHELSPSRLHLVFSVLTITVNLAVNVVEYRSIQRNSQLIGEVVQEVRRIRLEHGLPT